MPTEVKFVIKKVSEPDVFSLTHADISVEFPMGKSFLIIKEEIIGLLRSKGKRVLDVKANITGWSFIVG